MNDDMNEDMNDDVNKTIKYYDKTGKQILPGMYLIHDSGDIDKVILNKDKTDLGFTDDIEKKRRDIFTK